MPLRPLGLLQIMAENLGRWLPLLTQNDCNEIVDAMNKFCPSRRTNPLRYNTPKADLMFLNREKVIAALLEVYRVFGTATALATAHILQGPHYAPPADQPD
jgi:hypothetical protein